MKRINTTMIVGLMAGMVMLAGCKREYGTVTLGANIDNGRDAKVYIDDLTPCWHNNDLIRVNNQTCTTSAALGSSAQITDVVESNHYRAIYPADIVGDVDISNSSAIAVTLPHEQIYEVDSRGDQKVKVPMGAYSSNESLTFHNLCSLIKVVVNNRMDYDFVLGSITISAGTANLSGEGNATVSGSPNDAIGIIVSSSASHDVSLVFPVGSRHTIGRGDRDTYIYYIVAPEFAEDDITITLSSESGYYATFEKSGVSLQHNKMATVILTVEQFDGQNPPNVGVLPGAFSVSANQQVFFSQGNLQYCANTNTWRFAEHQYDYVGSSNSNISSTYSGWIDLFGWGTGNNPTFASTSNSAYSTFMDWGLNAISNGGQQPNVWRTLSHVEWSYLLNSRHNATSKYGSGNINGVGGFIILPDSWTLPSGCSFTSGFSEIRNNWTHNSYTLTQWSLMEAAGAVFLPAAGARFGESYYSCLTYNYGTEHEGYYWLTTNYDMGNSHCVDFVCEGVNAGIRNSNYGFSVRLVRDNN